MTRFAATIGSNILGILFMNGVFQFVMIYNVGGFGQTGWFFVFGNNILAIIQGVSQVLSSLAVVEIAPKGFEASIYEFLTTMHNAGITLNLNIMGLLQPVFHVNEIVDNGYNCQKSCQMPGTSVCSTEMTDDGQVAMNSNGNPICGYNSSCDAIDSWQKACDHDNTLMAIATGFTMAVNIVGVVLISFMIPRDKKDCKDWLEAGGCWKSVQIGVLGSVVGWGSLFFSLTVSFLSIIPGTTCLPIAGGSGC